MKYNIKLTFHTLIGIIIFLITVFPSCKKENRWDMLKRTGPRITETRDLPPFTKIFVYDNINVFITQGSDQEVKVEGGDNLVPLVKTEVKDGILCLKNKNSCNWARSYKKGIINVYATLPTVEYIRHLGSGIIQSTDTLRCDALTVRTHESGDVELTVKANIIYVQMGSTSDVTLHGISPLMGVYHVGEGYLYCEDLQTDIIWAYSKTSGNEYLNAKTSLAATLDWVGDIYYSGNPVINKMGTGNGKLIRQN